jgi:outer membrane protein assembly factor BamB
MLADADGGVRALGWSGASPGSDIWRASAGFPGSVAEEGGAALVASYSRLQTQDVVSELIEMWLLDTEDGEVLWRSSVEGSDARLPVLSPDAGLVALVPRNPGGKERALLLEPRDGGTTRSLPVGTTAVAFTGVTGELLTGGRDGRVTRLRVAP